MADQYAPPGMNKQPDPKPQKGGGFFGSKPKKEEPTVHIGELVVQLNNVSRRLRVLEERYTNLRKKSQVTDQNMISDHKRVLSEIKTTDSRVDDIRHDLTEMKENVRLIISELKLCAKKEDVAVLNKYINLWEPIQFVTRTELRRTIQEELRKQNL